MDFRLIWSVHITLVGPRFSYIAIRRVALGCPFE